MLQIVIPQDIRKYEPTLLGAFTTRQVIWGLIMMIGVYVIWGIEKALGVDPMTAPVWIIALIPGVLFGWIKPYGMKMEAFLASAFVSNVLAPKYRIYQIDNFYDHMKDEEEERESKSTKSNKSTKTKKKKKHKSQNPELVAYL